MDFGEVAGLAALLVSVAALWFGWRSDRTFRNTLARLEQLHEREAGRVDKLIELLVKRGGSG